MSASARQLRQRIAVQAGHRCGYYLTLEVVSGIPLTLEHIIPKSHGGRDTEDNLWLSYRLCNEARGFLTKALDPQTDTFTPLFNLRLQSWTEHFTWSEDGTQIIGLTAISRTTVAALSLNSKLRVRACVTWTELGWHPPKLDD